MATNYTTTDSTSNTAGGAWGYTSFRFRIDFDLPPAPPKPVGPCCHKLLGVACGAPREEIRQTYRRLAKIAHPDVGGDGRWMAVLNRLYEVAMGS